MITVFAMTIVMFLSLNTTMLCSCQHFRIEAFLGIVRWSLKKYRSHKVISLMIRLVLEDCTTKTWAHEELRKVVFIFILLELYNTNIHYIVQNETFVYIYIYIYNTYMYIQSIPYFLNNLRNYFYPADSV